MLAKTAVFFILSLTASASPLFKRQDATCTTVTTIKDILTAGDKCNTDFLAFKAAVDKFQGLGDVSDVQSTGQALKADMPAIKDALDCPASKPLVADESTQLLAKAETIAATAQGTLTSISGKYDTITGIAFLGDYIRSQVYSALQDLQTQVTAYNTSLCNDLQPADVATALPVMQAVLDQYNTVLQQYSQ